MGELDRSFRKPLVERDLLLCLAVPVLRPSPRLSNRTVPGDTTGTGSFPERTIREQRDMRQDTGNPYWSYRSLPGQADARTNYCFDSFRLDHEPGNAAPRPGAAVLSEAPCRQQPYNSARPWEAIRCHAPSTTRVTRGGLIALVVLDQLTWRGARVGLLTKQEDAGSAVDRLPRSRHRLR